MPAPRTNMAARPDHNELSAALRRSGSSWDAAQAHGLLCSRFAVQGDGAAQGWIEQVMEGTAPQDGRRRECEPLLEALWSDSVRQLAGRQSGFVPLLPDDEEPAAHRAQALAHWCEGFLHGLVAGATGDALRERLATAPLADVIRDLLQMTRATAGDDDDETLEGAWAELVEYLRVAVQLVYEELDGLRTPAAGGAASDAGSRGC